MAAQQIYINLPVNDLDKSMTFFSKLGFEFNKEFTNEQGACLILGENLFAMLLTIPFFKTFTTKEVVDARKAAEAIICFSVSSRKEVDDLVAKAKAAGSQVMKEPKDHGFMYYSGFEDLDGHMWEVLSYETKK